MAILWFGLNDTAIIFVVIIGAIFSITIATESGLKNIPTLYIRAGKNMGAKGLGMLWYVMLPAALPSIVTGLKQGWSFAWRSLMAGELLFVSLGLGHLLMMGRELNDMNRVVAVMFVIAFISILIDKLIFGRIEQGIKTKWGLIKN
jgi:NitT/TauT family transport system permease protein